jgi:hypothetical protein
VSQQADVFARITSTMKTSFAPGGFLDDTEVNAILGSRWAVDCLSMKLVRQGTDEVCYSGAGCIRHDSTKRLEYIIYDTATIEPFTRSFSNGLQAGDRLGPEHFYTLIATAVDGRTWMAEWLDADVDSLYGVPGVVIRGSIWQLTCESVLKSCGSAAFLHALGSL